MKNTVFRILTREDEKKLDEKELIEYYYQLREYYRILPINEVKLYLQKNIGNPIAIKICDSLIKNQKLEIVNKAHIPIDVPIIFAINHQHPNDVPTTLSLLRNYFIYPIGGKEIEKSIAGLFFKMKGIVFFDRDSRKSKLAAKEKILPFLNKGIHTFLCPEATWNISPSQIILPMHWGMIELAQKSGAAILPITYEFIGNTCYASIGDAVFPSPADNKEEAIVNLRDSVKVSKIS